ncbi:MAG: LamG-like jellyroll fold domain-containing protein [Parcubacteria group bacterium]|jgi:hypothetical protein
MWKKKSLGKKKRGSALVVALFILAIILISALSITLVAVKERLASVGSAGSNKAYQTSDTGIEKVMQAITRGNYETVGDMKTGAGFTCTGGMITGTGYEVELLDSANNPIGCNSSALVSTITRIKSIGTSSGTKRATEALVSNKITKSLFHFDDVDADSNFEDFSYLKAEYIITNSGTLSADTSEKKIGDGSALFSAGKYLEIEAKNSETLNNWNFSDNDFTIEAWVKIEKDPGPNKYTLVSRCEDSSKTNDCNFYFAIANSTCDLNFFYPSGGVFKKINYNNTSVCDKSWHHLVFERKGDKGYFFIDGSKHDASANFGTGDVITFDSDTAHKLRVGINFKSESADPKSQFIGNMDELRITKGVARYPITGFTPWDIEYAPND